MITSNAINSSLLAIVHIWYSGSLDPIKKKLLPTDSCHTFHLFFHVLVWVASFFTTIANMSTYDLIATLRSVQWHFSRIVLPTCFSLGNIGNTLNLLIFSQHESRTNSCLIYFLFASVIDFFILNFLLVLRMLTSIWNINPGQTSVWFCGWRSYLSTSSFVIYRCSILLACIDRMCASSKNAWVRKWSQPKIAYRMIAVNSIIWPTLFVPGLVVPILVYGQCYAPPYSKFAGYGTALALSLGILLPSSMLTCGFITFHHLKSMRSRVTADETGNGRQRRIAGQHVILVFVQVITDSLCNLSYPCYLIYTLIYSTPQTSEMTAIYTFWQDLSFNLPYGNFSAAFYLHTLSSPSFRRKLVHLVGRIGHVRPRCLRHVESNNEVILSMTLTTVRGRAGLN